MRRIAALAAVTLLTVGCSQVGSTPSTSPAGPATSSAASPSAASASPSVAASPATSPAASAGSQIEVTGVEYAFQGVPATAASGTTFTFRNDGSELHEMVVFRKNPGVTQTFEELLALPEAEAFALVTPVGGTMTAPGSTAPTTVTVTEPGEHLMVCFVPVGTTSASIDPSSPPTGEPHFTRGMLAEFDVE
jgi:plastocyanin